MTNPGAPQTVNDAAASQTIDALCEVEEVKQDIDSAHPNEEEEKKSFSCD